MKECVICNTEFADTGIQKHIRRMHTPIECQECSNSYTKYESRCKSNKYCSRACQYNSKLVKQNSKECKECKEPFLPTRKDKKYCKESCAEKFRGRRARDRNRAKLPLKKCLFCNEEVNRPRKYKYCSDKCSAAMNNEKSKAYGKRKVRESHAKKPPIHCKRCDIQLKTLVRNYHQLEFCPPCGKAHSQEKSKKNYEENKEEQLAYFKERHAKKMQDPEYREMVRLRSKARKDANPVMAECIICNKVFRKIRGAKTCSLKCSKEHQRRESNKPEKIMSKNLARQLHRAVDGRVSNWAKGIVIKNNVWTYFNFTIEEFRERFESLFTKGMTWQNMGLWHIDHIKPKVSFNQEQLADPTSEDFKKCWALENLQPLWALDNMKKGAKEMKV